jgi:hypothetical protein
LLLKAAPLFGAAFSILMRPIPHGKNFSFGLNFTEEIRFMKNIRQLFWLPSLALLIAGCASSHYTHQHSDPVLSEWQAYGEMLPPTGLSNSRVYADSVQPQPANYPKPPNIIVQSDRNSGSGDAVLANAIRHDIEYDMGLAPSFQHVVIVVQNGRLTLQGAVKSDLDSRVIVDNLRDITGVTEISNQLEINPSIN